MTRITAAIRNRFASYGLVAVAVDMRGRTTSSCTVTQKQGREIYDIYDAVVDVLVNYSQASTTNINIVGYSGGGGNAYMAAVRFPDYFDTIVPHFGMNDWRQWLLDLAAPTPDTADQYAAVRALTGVLNNKYSNIRIYHDKDDSSVDYHFATDWQASSTALGYTVTVDISSSTTDYIWAHGYPVAGNSPDLIIPENIWVPEILAGTSTSYDQSGDMNVVGWVRTSDFQIFLGNSDYLEDVVRLTYDISADASDYDNRKYWQVTNDWTSNATTSYFQVYGLEASTNYTVNFVNVTDGSTSTSDIASDGDGMLSFGNEMVADKVMRWEVYVATSSPACSPTAGSTWWVNEADNCSISTNIYHNGAISCFGTGSFEINGVTVRATQSNNCQPVIRNNGQFIIQP